MRTRSLILTSTAFVLALGAASIRAQDASRELREAEALFRDRRFREAAEILSRLVERDQLTGDAARLLGHAYVELGRKDDARAAFSTAIAAGRLDEDVLLRAAELAAEASDIARRRELLSLARLVAPDRWDIAINLAELEHKLGNTEEAKVALRRRIDDAPFDRDARLRLAEILLESGDRSGALAEYRIAHVLGDEDGSIARRLGDLARAEGELESALSWYERALAESKGESRVEIALALAKLYVFNGDSDAAAKIATALEKRLQEEKRESPAELLEILAHLDFERGEIDSAAKRWEAAVAAGSTTPEIPRALARYWLGRGDPAPAVPWLERWLAAEPENEEALIALAQANLPADGEAESEGGREARKKARDALVRLVRAHGLTANAREIVRALAAAATAAAQ